MKKKETMIQLFIIAVILVVANLLSNSAYFRLDFTEDKRYTLSNATKNVIKNLDDAVTITAYVSEEVPTDILTLKQEFEDMLREYEEISNGNIVYKFVNPQAEDENEQEIQQKGIFPARYTKRENDRAEEVIFYHGAQIHLGERMEVIPFVQSVAMEHDLTMAIKKLSITDKPKIGIIQGHGEIGLASLPQLQQQLSVLNDVEEFNLNDGAIPTYFSAVVLAAPQDTISSQDFKKLEDYLASGGGIFISHSNVYGDFQQGIFNRKPDIGLNGWLQNQGVIIGGDFVTDARCGNITLSQQTPFGMMRTQKQFPYFPAVSNFGDHPSVKGLEQITFQFATTVVATPMDSLVRSTNLMLTSENSGVVPAPVFLDIEKRWTQNDFGKASQPLAVALEGLGNGLGKMIVVGNGDFFSNGEGQQMRQIQSDHVSFAANSVDWLADDTGLIELRTKGITARPLDELEDSTRQFYKYGNVFVPILILMIYGFIRRIQNQRKISMWREGNFE